MTSNDPTVALPVTFRVAVVVEPTTVRLPPTPAEPSTCNDPTLASPATSRSVVVDAPATFRVENAVVPVCRSVTLWLSCYTARIVNEINTV